MVDPCFTYCHILCSPKLLLVLLKQLQTTLWIVNVLLFLINCKPTQHPLWTWFSHWQILMQNEESTAFFNSSAISCNFNFWLAKVSWWSFQVFSRTTAKFGQPDHSTSIVSLQPHLKSPYHLLTIISDGAESK